MQKFKVSKHSMWRRSTSKSADLTTGQQLSERKKKRKSKEAGENVVTLKLEKNFFFKTGFIFKSTYFNNR